MSVHNTKKAGKLRFDNTGSGRFKGEARQIEIPYEEPTGKFLKRKYNLDKPVLPNVKGSNLREDGKERKKDRKKLRPY